VWAPEQVRAFLESLGDDRLSAMWRLFATTGCRRGEVLGLRWKDVDLTESTVSVRQNVVLVDHQIIIEEPKSAAGRRTIKVDPETVAALRSHRLRQKEERIALGPAWTDTGHVFTRQDGNIIHPERVTKWFEQKRKKVELPKLTLHGLRHSHATALLRGGVPIAVVSKRLGHASVGITLGTYAHALPGDDEAAAVLGAALLAGS
jgi:integrase